MSYIVRYQTKSGGIGHGYFESSGETFFYAIRLLDDSEIIKVQIIMNNEIYSIKKD